MGHALEYCRFNYTFNECLDVSRHVILLPLGWVRYRPLGNPETKMEVELSKCAWSEMTKEIYVQCSFFILCCEEVIFCKVPREVLRISTFHIQCMPASHWDSMHACISLRRIESSYFLSTFREQGKRMRVILLFEFWT